MRCPVCGHEHKDLICSVCGFDESLNLVQYMTLSPVSDTVLKKLASEKEAWDRKAELEVYVMTHYYKEDGELLVLDHSEKTLLAKGINLKPKEVTWCDTRFPRIDAMEILTVCIFIKNQDSEKKVHVMIDNPYGNGFWKAGIKLMDSRKMIVRFVLGPEDGSEYQESDDFYLKL